MLAETKLNFEHSKPDFVEHDKYLMQQLEQARLAGGTVVVFIDMRDADYLPAPDEDNNFHYALLGFTNQDTTQLAGIMPLPVFAVVMGWTTENDTFSEYGKINKSFHEVVDYLRNTFHGNVFFGSRGVLNTGGYYEKDLHLLPRANDTTLAMIHRFGDPEIGVITDEQMIQLMQA